MQTHEGGKRTVRNDSHESNQHDMGMRQKEASCALAYARYEGDSSSKINDTDVLTDLVGGDPSNLDQNRWSHSPLERTDQYGSHS